MAVITADEGVRGGKTIPLKATMDKALESCRSVKCVLVMQRTGRKDLPMGENHLFLQEVKLQGFKGFNFYPALAQVMDKESDECSPELMSSEDYLFLLYTSGSTGKPKGLAHSTAGYLTYAGLTHRV